MPGTRLERNVEKYDMATTLKKFSHFIKELKINTQEIYKHVLSISALGFQGGKNT